MPLPERLGPDPIEDTCPWCGKPSAFGDPCRYCKHEEMDREDKYFWEEHDKQQPDGEH